MEYVDVGYDDSQYGFIYMTRNNINNHIYVGQKKYDKHKLYLSYLGSGKLLHTAIEKYGKENFSKIILENCSTKELLDEREIYWIEKTNALNNKNYNMAKGGAGGDTLRYCSEEYKLICKQKRVAKLKGINKGSKNHCAKKVICLNNNIIFDTIVDASKYAKVNPEGISDVCKNFSKGNYYRTAGKDPVTNEKLHWAFYDDNFIKNYKGFDYYLDKINEHNEKIKDKRRKLHKIYLEKFQIKPKKVQCVTDGKIFNSIQDAMEFYHVSRDTITYSCNNGTSSRKRNLRFKYI